MARSEEPPSTNLSQLVEPLWLVGRNAEGQWVVRDRAGLHGGLFVDRTQAIKFALSENGNHPQAVMICAGPVELDIGPHGLATAA